MKNHVRRTRRDFLKTSLFGGAGLAAAFPARFAMAQSLRQENPRPNRVALTAGEDRTDNIFQALKPFEEEIKAAIGNRRVVIKPNNVSIDRQLAATHVDCMEGILEFLTSIGKSDNVVIAESAAQGPTFDGFENFNYFSLGDKYPLKFIDLDKEDYQIVYTVDENDIQPHGARMSKMLLDRKTNFVISSAVMKTHDRVVATLSLKNIVFGAPIKDEGFSWGRNRREGAKTDKPIPHGGGFRGINYNLFALAPMLRPDLSVIDGYQGMQGNGPTGGTPVEHRVAVVSPNWFAADRVAVELMGIDFADIGYLNYCARAGIGEPDVSKIEVIGESIVAHQKKYQLHDRIERQLVWKKA